MPRRKETKTNATGVANALQRDFPFEQLQLVAELESWRKEVARPVYHVHKWWAQRLGSVFRTILLAGSLPEDADVWGSFYARKELGKVVLDPFMGSGTTLGEALKLGCKVVGCDINPVAYFSVKKTLTPISEERLRAAFTRLQDRVAPKIKSFYTADYNGKPAEILYTFWVMTVDCPECSATVPLFSKWIFSSHAYPKKHPTSKALCPSCGEINDVNHFTSKHACGSCRITFDPQEGPATGQTASCPECEATFKIREEVRRSSSPPKYRMYALLLLTDDGKKVYRRVLPGDLARYDAASAELRRTPDLHPRVEIPSGINTDQARGYNFQFWHQMFNDRQLLTLGLLLGALLDERDVEAREQLLLLFSGVLEFNNMFCSFKGEGTGAVRHLFSHHILKPERTPLEANPWGTDRSSGAFSTLFERRLIAAKRYCADPSEIRPVRDRDRMRGEKVLGINQPIAPRMAARFEELSDGIADALVLCGDSSRLPIPDASVDLVVTDPPYFDNVHYSELADFFFCWLAKGLARTEVAFRRDTTRNSGEVQAADADDFARALGRVFAECVRVMKPRGTLAFTFHHSRPEAWVAVAKAIVTAGLEVAAAHPVKAEMSVAVPKQQAKEPINLDLIVVCRRAGEAAASEGASAAEHVRRLRRTGMSLSRGDVRVVVMGTLLRRASLTRETGDFGELFAESAALVEELYLRSEEAIPARPAPPQLALFS